VSSDLLESRACLSRNIDEQVFETIIETIVVEVDNSVAPTAQPEHTPRNLAALGHFLEQPLPALRKSGNVSPASAVMNRSSRPS
jgi:hypothetical protein